MSSSGGATLDFGTQSNCVQWLQATNLGNLALNYSLLLNPNGGSVGIGTTAPADLMHIYSSGKSANLGYVAGNGTRQWRAGVRGDTSSAYAIQDDTANAMRLVINISGNVGIGTTAPATTLDVAGDVSTGNGGILWKTFSGTTNAGNAPLVSFAHGLAATKILTITCSVIYNTYYYQFGSLATNTSTNYTTWDGTNAYVYSNADSNWYSKPYRCIAQYVK
jgi:hypothetical protein